MTTFFVALFGGVIGGLVALIIKESFEVDDEELYD